MFFIILQWEGCSVQAAPYFKEVLEVLKWFTEYPKHVSISLGPALHTNITEFHFHLSQTVPSIRYKLGIL